MDTCRAIARGELCLHHEEPFPGTRMTDPGFSALIIIN
jgi:hypothetical protein